MINHSIGRWLLIGMLFWAACVPAAEPSKVIDPDLRFAPRITMFEKGKVQFELGISNEPGGDQPRIDDGNIQVTITEEKGKIRNQMQVVDVGLIQENHTEFSLTFEAAYDPGRYVVSLTGEVLPSLSFPFEIREEDGIRKLAAAPKSIQPHTEFTLDASDL